jgi:hypothetical protein
MTEFDVDAYLEAIEIPAIKINGKRYEARVLSVEEWSPYQVRYAQYLDALHELLPEEKKDKGFEKVADADFIDQEKLQLLKDGWDILRVDYFYALFGHWKSKFKPWTWFRPNLIRELENLPNKDVVFGDFFALRVAAGRMSARN